MLAVFVFDTRTLVFGIWWFGYVRFQRSLAKLHFIAKYNAQYRRIDTRYRMQEMFLALDDNTNLSVF